MILSSEDEPLGINVLIKISLNSPSEISLVSTPFLATEIEPVSSETTTTIASLSSVKPTAARWRVPKRVLSCFFVSGKIQPAARILPFLTTIAPS